MSDEEINVFSAFDGKSCGQLALIEAGIKYNHYFASEIDKHSIEIAMKNFPLTKQVGDICNFSVETVPKIDLVLGGSPCQGFSFAGKQLAFDDPRSKLFFEYERVLKEAKIKNPGVKFLLENVMMEQKYIDIISKRLGFEPIIINSRLVSAQNRERLYWTNIEDVKQPNDKGILLDDILEKDHGKLKKYIHSKKAWDYMNKKGSTGRIKWSYKFHSDVANGKSACVTANFLKGVPNNALLDKEGILRKFTPIECERLQTLPDNYTDGVSNTNRYKMIGNGWTIDVIAHILKNINISGGYNRKYRTQLELF